MEQSSINHRKSVPNESLLYLHLFERDLTIKSLAKYGSARRAKLLFHAVSRTPFAKRFTCCRKIARIKTGALDGEFILAMMNLLRRRIQLDQKWQCGGGVFIR